jgi:hypothetical protein
MLIHRIAHMQEGRRARQALAKPVAMEGGCLRRSLSSCPRLHHHHHLASTPLQRARMALSCPSPEWGLLATRITRKRKRLSSKVFWLEQALSEGLHREAAAAAEQECVVCKEE